MIVIEFFRSSFKYVYVGLQKKLVGHPNIVDFVSAASIDKKDSDHGQAEFLILTELCTGKYIVDLI